MLRRTPYAVRRSCCRAAFCSAAETAKQRHHEFLVRMYAAAPISGLFNKHELKYEEDGSTTLEFTLEKKHCHTAGSLHGSGYFKLLDDAAFFAAQGKVDDYFLFTTSFNIYMLRPCLPGTTLVARGWVTNATKQLLVAESRLETKDGKLVGTASGSFMKSPHMKLSALEGCI